MFGLLYKETLLNINGLDSSLPSVVFSLLQEFKDVFPEDGPRVFHMRRQRSLNAKWRN